MNALRLASAPSLPLSTPTLHPDHLSDLTDHERGPFHSPARACLIHAFQSHHVTLGTWLLLSGGLYFSISQFSKEKMHLSHRYDEGCAVKIVL